MLQQLSQMSSHLPADGVDVKLCENSVNDVESDEDGTDGSLQFFVSSAAAHTPLVGPLLSGGGLETTAVIDASSCSAVMDFTAVVSPSKVSKIRVLIVNVRVV